jgi:hypothetical protein
MFDQQLARHGLASAASGAHPEALLEVSESAGAPVRTGADLAFRDRVADADVHSFNENHYHSTAIIPQVR